MKPKKQFTEWNNVFLDTTVLLDYGRAQKKGITDERSLFAKLLLDSYASLKPTGKVDRKFTVSTISISEMVKIVNDQDLSSQILRAFGATNIELVSWSRQLAIFSNAFCSGYLSNDQLNKLIDETMGSVANKKLAREYLLKDFMLITTAKFCNCDVILTSDSNTFLPIADVLNVPCIVVDPGNFQHTPAQVFSFW